MSRYVIGLENPLNPQPRSCPVVHDMIGHVFELRSHNIHSSIRTFPMNSNNQSIEYSHACIIYLKVTICCKSIHVFRLQFQSIYVIGAARDGEDVASVVHSRGVIRPGLPTGRGSALALGEGTAHLPCNMVCSLLEISIHLTYIAAGTWSARSQTVGKK